MLSSRDLDWYLQMVRWKVPKVHFWMTCSERTLIDRLGDLVQQTLIDWAGAT